MTQRPYEQGWRDAIREAAKMLLHRDDDWAMWNTEAIAECARYVALMQDMAPNDPEVMP